MQPSRSTFLSAVVATVTTMLVAHRADAQSCCAGSVAATPGRLAMYEDGLVAMQAKVSRSYGSHDTFGHYAKDGPGSRELDFEQDLLGTVRLSRRLEVGVIVPFVETSRRASNVPDSGGGIGDVALVGRYDILREHEQAPLGLAVVAGVTFPTGRPVDKSTHVLAADATGTGAFQGTAGVLVEKTVDAWFGVVAAYVSRRTARTIEGVSSQLGTQGSFTLALGRSFDDDSAVALFIARTIEASSRYGDETAPGRALTSVGVTALHPFNDRWRMQASLAANPPFDGWGKNESAMTTLTLMIARGWS